jgi:hypothetical protein
MSGASVAGIIVAIAAFTAFYLREAYLMGVRHGRRYGAIDLDRSREQIAGAESDRDSWRRLAEAWRRIAARKSPIRGSAEKSRLAIRASATMAGLHCASGDVDSAIALVSELVALCAFGDNEDDNDDRPAA